MPCKQGVIYLFRKIYLQNKRDIFAFQAKVICATHVICLQGVCKALTIAKVGLSVCLAMNFRKTQTSARFVAKRRYRKFGRAWEVDAGHRVEMISQTRNLEMHFVLEMLGLRRA